MIQAPKFVFVATLFLTGALSNASPLTDADFIRLSQPLEHGNKHTLVYEGERLDQMQIYSEGQKLDTESFELRYGRAPHPGRSQANNDMTDPFILAHPYKTPYIVIYFHGITDSAYQGKDLGRSFFNAGENFMSARLSGHGIDSANINYIELSDWRQDVDEAIASARPLGDKVILVGLSTGGALILDKAYADPASVAAVIAVAPAIGILNSWVRDLEAVGLFNPISVFVPFVGDKNMTQIEVRQRQKGTHAVHVLYDLGQAVQERIEDGEPFPQRLFMISSSKDTDIQPQWLSSLMNLAPYGKPLSPELTQSIHSGIAYNPEYVVHQVVYTDQMRAEGKEFPYATLDESNPEYDRMFDGILNFIKNLPTSTGQQVSR